MSQVEVLWADALKLYEDKAGRDISKEPGIREIRTTDDLLHLLELKDANFAKYRKKNGKFWRALNGCMQPITLLGGLTVSGLSLSPFAPASQVLGAVLFLVKAADGVSDAYDRISEMFETLQDFAVRIEEYARFDMNDSLKQKVTSIMAVSEKMIRKGRVKEYVNVTFFQGSKKLQEALDRLKRLFDTEQKLVISQTYSTTRGLVKSVDEVALALNDSRRRADEHAERKIIKESLGSPAADRVREIYAEINEKRLSGTGEWILREPLFQQWLKREISILWVLGGPGAGKSFLSSAIVEHLHRAFSHDLGASELVAISVGYFYIKEDDLQLRSVNTILKTFALQLADQDPEYRAFIAVRCKNQDNFSSIRSTWRNLFLEFYDAFTSSQKICYLLIDGLDEALRDEREGFLKAIKVLDDHRFELDRSTIQIVLVGRPELREDIWSIWEKRFISIEVSASKNQHDIAEYIQKGLSRVKLLRNRNVPAKDRLEMSTEITRKLTDGNGGMFLWINLMLDQIQHKQRKSQLQAALNDAPTDIHKMIQSVFDRLADNPAVFDIKEDLNEILAWVTCAQRPLFLGELEDILKMRPPVGEGLPGLEDLLRSQFASFFTITRKDNLSTDDLIKLAQERPPKDSDHENPVSASEIEGSDDIEEEGFSSEPWSTVVQFSHASIRDYLVSSKTRESSTSGLGIGVNVQRTELNITKLCLEILSGNNPIDTTECDTDKFYDADDLSYKVASKPVDREFWNYCNDFFVSHLASLRSHPIDPQDCLSILRYLYKLFFDPTATKRWFLRCKRKAFATTWFKESRSRNCVMAWFQDLASLGEAFTPEERAVMIKAGRSAKELLENIAAICGDLWLRDETQIYVVRSGTIYMFYRYLYSILDDDDALTQLGPGNSWQLLSWWYICSESQIRDLAESCQIPKSAFWHGRLASTLEYAGYINQSIQEISLGLKLQPDSAWLLSRLASSYVSKLDYASALKVSRAALEVSETPQERSDILWGAALWSLEAGNIEEAIEFSKRGYQPYLGIISQLPYEAEECISTHFMGLQRASQYQQIRDLATDLDLRPSIEGEFSYLTELVLSLSDEISSHNIYAILGTAATQLSDILFISKILDNALDYAEKQKSSKVLANARQNVAKTMQRFTGQSKESLALWEYVLKTMSPEEEKISSGSNPWSDTLTSVVSIYLRHAYEAEANYGDWQQWISKIEQWVTRPKLAHTEVNTFSTTTASLALGIWSRARNRNDIAVACFRTYAHHAFVILSDADTSNDIEGYEILAWCLFYAGDLENFHAIINWMFQLKHAIHRQYQISNDENEEPATVEFEFSSILKIQDPKDATEISAGEPQTSTSQTDIKISPGDIEESLQGIFLCNGNCVSEPADLESYYVCHYCIEARFCKRCYEKFKADGFSFEICMTGHTFYQVLPAQKPTLGIDNVDVGGVIMETDVWLDGLREKWYG